MQLACVGDHGLRGGDVAVEAGDELSVEFGNARAAGLFKLQHKAAVDLQTVNRKLAQVAQRRVAGAEVVDGDGDTERTQGRQKEALDTRQPNR